MTPIDDMAIYIRGIGWLTQEGCGCVRSGLRQAFENGEDADSLPQKGIFSHPFKNFGRMDAVSRSTAYAVALAMQDAGIEYSPERKRDIGIIGTNGEGSLRADLEFFRDYINGGRKLSRGNLFIYTLPSSPLGEAAIHFGLQGPMYYAGGLSLVRVLDTASGMIASGESPIILAGLAEVDEPVFFVLSQSSERDSGVLSELTAVRSVIESSISLPDMIRKLETTVYTD